MKDKGALKRLENQLVLLYALGRWTASVIAKRLNQDKLDDIGYTAEFVDEKFFDGKTPITMASSGILVLRDLSNGPDPQPNFPVAVISTDTNSVLSGRPIMPLIQISPRTKKYLSPNEYQRFLEVMKQIANEMGSLLIEE